MINQLQRHFVTAFRADQRVLPEAFGKALRKRFRRQNAIASRVVGHIGRQYIVEPFSAFVVSHVAMQAVISDSLKTLWQNVLSHSSHEFYGWKCLMFDLPALVVAIPVADGFAVITIYPSDRDRRRDHILGKIFRESFSAGRDISRLKKGDESFWVVFPCPVDVFCNGRIADVLFEHVQQMKLPFSVHDFIRNVRDRFPFVVVGYSASGHENVKMRIIMAGASCRLENDDISHIEFDAAGDFENIFETVVSRLHENTEQLRVSEKPRPQEFRSSQNDVPISDSRQEASSDEVCPFVGVDFCAREAEAGFAGEGYTSGFSAMIASVLSEAHFFGVAAVKHFLDGVVVVRRVKSWMGVLKRIPMIVENLLECVFVDAFHGCLQPTTVTELTKPVEKRVEITLC